VPEIEPSRETVIRHPRFGPGLHVAPFRGDKGELLVVAIGQDGGLDALWPVQAIGTWDVYHHYPPLAPMDWQRELAIDRSADRAISVYADERLLASDPGLHTRYQQLHLRTLDVVHVCPWLGRIDRQAMMVATTDALGCAKAFEEGRDLNALTRSALAFLRAIREDQLAGSPGSDERPLCYHSDIAAAIEAREASAATNPGGAQ
jgi:hypothetical protein